MDMVSYARGMTLDRHRPGCVCVPVSCVWRFIRSSLGFTVRRYGVYLNNFNGLDMTGASHSERSMITTFFAARGRKMPPPCALRADRGAFSCPRSRNHDVCVDESLSARAARNIRCAMGHPIAVYRKGVGRCLLDASHSIARHAPTLAP